METIGISNFVKRQTMESEFTHFFGTWEELVTLVAEQFNRGRYFSAYRDGVKIVPMRTENCSLFGTYTGYPMHEGMKLEAEYRKVVGREHEPPKLIVTPEESKIPCKYVDIILYRADVLEEDKDDVTGADWDIVSINGMVKKDPPPIDPMTLVRNYPHLKGGTKMKGTTPEQMLEMLCESILYKNGLKHVIVKNRIEWLKNGGD